MGKKQYSDLDKANALNRLELNEGNLTKTSKELNIPFQTLHCWANQKGINAAVLEIRKHEKTTLIDIAERAAYALGELILVRAQNPSPFDKTSELSVSFGIVVDKIQLLKGEPTSINRNLSPEERQAKLDEIKARREAKAS